MCGAPASSTVLGMLPRTSLLAAAALTAAALVPTAAQAGGWSTGVPTSAPGAAASAPVVAAGADGGVTAAWIRGGHVQAGVRGAGGTFAAADVSGDGATGAPALAVAPDGGRAVLAWVRDGVVEAAVRPGAGQPFGTPAPLSGAGVDGRAVRVGIDAAGAATVLWIRGNLVEVARRAAGDATWPAARATFSETQPSRPALAVTPSGRAVATWSALQGATFVLRTAARPAAGPWGAASTVEDVDDVVGDGVDSDLAAEGADDVTGVWPQFGAWRHPVIRAGRRVAGGAWGALTPISLGEANDNASSPRPAVAANAAGDAAAVWLHDVGEVSRVDLAVRAGAGGFSAPATVSAEGGVDRMAAPDVAVDGAGRALAAWVRDGAVEAIRGGGAAVAVSGAGSGAPRVTADAAGGAVVVWAREGRIETAAYDAVAPALDTIAAPAGGRAGETLAFTAQGARDGESPVRVRWDFGDGAAAVEGEAVTHRFAAAGTYAVTATAVDGGGNTTARTAQVTVAPVPVTGSGPGEPGDGTRGGGGGTTKTTDPAHGQLSAYPDRDGRAPRLSGLVVAPRRPRAGARATLRVTLDEAATVTIRLTRGGKVVGRPLTRRLAAGRATIRLGAKLAAGRHTLSLVATDAAGNRARTARLTFTVAAVYRRR